MKRKHLFGLGYAGSILSFVSFYSYFWYSVGETPFLINDWSFIFWILYTGISLLASRYYYKNSYYETKEAIYASLFYIVPILFLILALLMSGSSFTMDGTDIFAYYYIGLFSLISLIYLTAMIIKEDE